ncbi:anti-sigma factor [Microbacterium jejuense]|uniref:Anti-sigma factor n=1 Tax=Microbacterium jejuense TaxID=1263637 RepID=A0ABS7HMU1_9MICO|nr:anti-sigma factor [Microbacterium jejuense]MBW9093218.1 anti-sigma factor [Microbacterium jejuense]
MDEQEFAQLAAGAALRALSPADLEAFEAARREHPEWEQLVEADAATAAALADAVPGVVPPPAVRAELLSRLTSTPQAQEGSGTSAPSPRAPAAGSEPPVAPVRRAPRRWTRGILALAASVALFVALGVGAALISDYVNRPPAVVALQQIEEAPDARSATGEIADGGSATAHWSESVGKAVVVTEGLPRIAEDETFELWLVRDGEPLPAGTFEPASGTTAALLNGAMEPGDVIAVTVEPQGGSPTGEPSSDPILAIPTA